MVCLQSSNDQVDSESLEIISLFEFEQGTFLDSQNDEGLCEFACTVAHSLCFFGCSGDLACQTGCDAVLLGCLIACGGGDPEF